MCLRRYFIIMAVECTDISNKEHITICIRWVGDDLTDYENFLRLFEAQNISADTRVHAIKDMLLHMNLCLARCQG